MAYIEVLLPLSFDSNLTYRVNEELHRELCVGQRVIVPLGKKNKFYTGIITSLNIPEPQVDYEIKDVTAVPDDFPIVIYPQLKLWSWIADYYLCTQGDVMKAALPAALKLESETFIEVTNDFDEKLLGLQISDKESIIINIIASKGKITPQEIEKLTGLKNIGPVIVSLLEKEVIMISERLQEKFHPKKSLYVKLNRPLTKEGIASMFDLVKNAPGQERLLQYIIYHSQKNGNHENPYEIARRELLAGTGVGVSALEGLIKKDIVTQFKKEIRRFSFEGSVKKELPVLTEVQQDALKQIKDSFERHNVTLLRGVTSSGKTEIYQHLINDALKEKGQVLLLVPEIALTTQLTDRMQSVFGDKVVIYHSKFSDEIRVEVWLKLLKDKTPCVIIGARSSVFLPFSNLKYIIIDEEHDASYKQVDPAPRYNARDVAIMLASMHGAKTLLGSATPSIESYWKASEGKFGLVELTTRYGEVALPELDLVDMTQAYKKGQVSGGFALSTLQDIREAVDNKKQVIIFQNRRGYAPMARCKMCGLTPTCHQCDVTLTYHKHIDSLVCHYCGNVYPVPDQCPQCKEHSVEIIGYGTERIEEEIAGRMPHARLERMDLDTTRNKDSYSRIIEEFSSHKKDILIGTQMVTKGFDFGEVANVVVTNADSIINYPDFRSSERAFNILDQVSGRAGRRSGSTGKVTVQTFNTAHRIFKHLVNHDYIGYFKEELEERRKFKYPPFGRIIHIYLKHRDREVLARTSQDYATLLRSSLHDRVFGPDEPEISKIQNLYIRRIMLKFEPDISLKRIKEYLKEINSYMQLNKKLNNVIVYFDVDPV